MPDALLLTAPAAQAFVARQFCPICCLLLCKLTFAVVSSNLQLEAREGDRVMRPP